MNGQIPSLLPQTCLPSNTICLNGSSSERVKSGSCGFAGCHWNDVGADILPFLPWLWNVSWPAQFPAPSREPKATTRKHFVHLRYNPLKARPLAVFLDFPISSKILHSAFAMVYIRQRNLPKLHEYKYSGVDKSLVSKYILKPFYTNVAIKCFPMSMA